MSLVCATGATGICQVLTILVIWYICTHLKPKVERVQTGIRLEKRLLKVLKGLAEQLDMSVGDLIEGMALHCFEGKPPFSGDTLTKIEQLKTVYDLDWTAADSHIHKDCDE